MTTDQPACRTVAFVDDDADMRRANARSLELAGHDVRLFEGAAAALKAIGPDFPGVVVSDLRMPGMDGMQLFRTLREADPDLPVILITGHGDVATAVAAIREGAYDFITKPYQPDVLLRVIVRGLEQRRLTLENRRLRRDAERAAESSVLIGQSPAIEQLRRTIDQLGDAEVDILIEGETGTGKTLVASLLHRSSRRRGRPMATVDCGALPVAVIDSELFGHVAGAFPGAQHSRTGRIEAAGLGTLFLDGIDALPLVVQPKLLRAIEDRVITPLGANDVRPIDVRIIAASTGRIEEMARSGTFLPRLLYRLNSIVLRLPPLRERREDIPLLFDNFLRDMARRHKRDVPPITEHHRDMFQHHGWFGNVRELMHYAERTVLGLERPATPATPGSLSLADRVARFEAEEIRRVLAEHDGKVTAAVAAARMPRKTFYDKMRRYNIDPAKWRTPEAGRRDR
ncbi:sigma-54-dependent transcriptional regulator [Hephaestia mangrovi]|uniref:sigma-54-dependent transcriptional regulator n=1 Tax=Hephaestia mangrovi TaxID=2873268 RepID=UPI001CA7A0FB|nr:sigma-54 dependent transcriptional regulator [Hephaestia mangrovi]MBY8828580.1 sigma-54 dependent transcriptional regulator [Hephaestia mangrovi]